MSQKEARDLVKELCSKGWTEQRTGSGHYKMIHPSGRYVVFAHSPSDFRWVKNARANIKRVEQDYERSQGKNEAAEGIHESDRFSRVHRLPESRQRGNPSRIAPHQERAGNGTKSLPLFRNSPVPHTPQDGGAWDSLSQWAEDMGGKVRNGTEVTGTNQDGTQSITTNAELILTKENNMMPVKSIDFEKQKEENKISKHSTPEMRSKAVEMLAEGKSFKQVGEEFGYHESWMNQMLSRVYAEKHMTGEGVRQALAAKLISTESCISLLEKNFFVRKKQEFSKKDLAARLESLEKFMETLGYKPEAEEK